MRDRLRIFTWRRQRRRRGATTRRGFARWCRLRLASEVLVARGRWGVDWRLRTACRWQRATLGPGRRNGQAFRPRWLALGDAGRRGRSWPFFLVSRVFGDRNFAAVEREIRVLALAFVEEREP